MKTTKHTPAPWDITGKEIRGANSLIIGTLYNHLPINQSEEEAMANARLIAAAPELLEALEEAMSILNRPEWKDGQKM